MAITEAITAHHHHILGAEEVLLQFTPLELLEEDTVKVEVIIIDRETIMHQRAFQAHHKDIMREVREVIVGGIGKIGAVIEDQRTEVVV